MNEKRLRQASKIRYITAVFLYGTIGLMVHYINLPSEVIVLCRGVIGTFFILCYTGLTGRRLDRKAVRSNLPWLILSGICLGLNWVFLFAAYRYTTVAVASLCNYMAPIIVIFLSPFLFHEKLGGKKLLCVFSAFAGIVLVSGVGAGGGADIRRGGVALGLAAAACFVGLVLCNRKMRNLSAYDKALVQLGVSAATVLPYVIFNNYGTGLHPDHRSALLVLILGVVHTGMAYCLYFGSLGELPVQTISILGYIEPVVSVLSSALILREPLSAGSMVGAVLIIGAAVASEMIS
ncbi:MAG: DMT family transporter [Clostridium sp.]|nr:DMT family transporter [Acetatifactor muris]MCM1527481.1 DMT family transporter [Bacteroides sp.]MCM1562075.1 DMT family transporter [Clostridium sp.]